MKNARVKIYEVGSIELIESCFLIGSNILFKRVQILQKIFVSQPVFVENIDYDSRTKCDTVRYKYEYIVLKIFSQTDVGLIYLRPGKINMFAEELKLLKIESSAWFFIVTANKLVQMGGTKLFRKLHFGFLGLKLWSFFFVMVSDIHYNMDNFTSHFYKWFLSKLWILEVWEILSRQSGQRFNQNMALARGYNYNELLLSVT